MSSWKSVMGMLAAACILGTPVLAWDHAEEEPEPAYRELAECAPPDCRLLASKILGRCWREQTGIELYGWLSGGATTNDWGASQAGGFVNGDWADDDVLGGATAFGPNTPLGFNDLEEFQLNQLYLVLERAIHRGSDCPNFGFRVDLLYGTDARFTRARGLDDNIIINEESLLYKMAIPQLYGSAYLPVGGGLEVLAGHFYTIVGYEVVPAPENFFYSHSYAMVWGEPKTHTGILGAYHWSDTITVWDGIIRGWDDWEDNNNALSYLGGLSWTSRNERTTVALTMVHGPEHNEPGILGTGTGFERDRSLYSLVATQRIGCRLTYVFQHDHGWDNGGPIAAAEWYGLLQYLFIDIHDTLSLGFRSEWFRDDDGVRVGAYNRGNPGLGNGGPFGGYAGDFHAVSAGVNWRPHRCAVVRPELRWDWFEGLGLLNAGGTDTPYGNGTRPTQFSAAVDLIVNY